MIAIDLDGTLLKSDGTLSDYTVAIIKKIQEQGHLVIITTGRPYRMALEFYKILGLKTPMINFNGSLIHIPEKKWAGEHKVRIDRRYLFDVLKNEKAFEAEAVTQSQKVEKEKVVKVREEKKRMTYQEKQEWASIEGDIEALENRISSIEEEMLVNGSDFGKLATLQKELDEKNEDLLEKYERYEYLSELV